MSDAATPTALEPAQLPGNLDRQTYTVRNLATMLQCSDRHVWRLADQNLIPGKIRLGRLVRFSRRLVDEWIAGGCKPIRTRRA
jgi:excisionase family DNA binding protein